MTIGAVLFDLDDTLTDRWASVERYAELFWRDFGERLTERDRTELCRKLWNADQGGHNARRTEELLGSFGWTDPPSSVELNEHWIDLFPGMTIARQGALSLVESLRALGAHVGVVTNGPTAVQRLKLRLAGLWGRIDSCTTSEAVGAKKPDPRMFERACVLAGTPASECVFVGDHPELDVLAAERVGMYPVWLQMRGEWPAALGARPATATSLAVVGDIARGRLARR